jgi:hypothetical protein
LWSAAYVFWKAKERSIKRRIFPLAVTTALLLILVLVPFISLYLKMDYHIHRSGREEVVRLIESGKIKYEGRSRNNVKLPDKYKKHSKNGDVLLLVTDEGCDVFFFTFIGVLDNFSGYLRVARDSEESVLSFFQEENLAEVSKIADHWYWVASK